MVTCEFLEMFHNDFFLKSTPETNAYSAEVSTVPRLSLKRSGAFLTRIAEASICVCVCLRTGLRFNEWLNLAKIWQKCSFIYLLLNLLAVHIDP